MTEFVRHLPCEACGSSDAASLYADGHTFCFACSAWSAGDGGHTVETKSKESAFLTGSYQDIKNRKLREDICRKYGYSISEYKGEPCHLANFRTADGTLVAQKVRSPGKKFSVVGDGKNMPLFGQHLFNGGKSVVITEGEIDALSVATAFDGKWPCVSLPSGAQSAVKAVEQHYEWLSQFEKVVLCFDQDEPGKKAMLAVAEKLPVGKAFIMRLPEPYKDPNEVLVALGTGPLTQAYWNASPWRPDGIVAIKDLRERVLNPVIVPSLPYPWMGLNAKLGGLRKGEMVTITSGSGLGKSTLLREIAYDLLMNHGQAIGGMFLEESNVRTIEGLMSIHLNKNLIVDRRSASQQELTQAYADLSDKPLYLWDHFGSNDVDTVISKIRYMAKALNVDYVLLDHLSILVSGIDTGDERRTIDVALTKLRTLVSEVGIGLILVSHLRRPSGDKGFEDGATVSLNALRGSHSIAQLSDAVIGLQKDADDPTSDALHAVVLKNRFSGDKGHATALNYDRSTGRLLDSHF